MPSSLPPVAFAAILVMAGQGRRLGGSVPKAFVPLAGRALWEYAAETLASTPGCVKIVLVAPAVYVGQLASAAAAMKVPCVVTVGGARRQDSVRAGVEALGDVVSRGVEVVAVHDAARPLIREDTILACVRDGLTHGAALAAVPARDTVKEVDDSGRVARTLDRSRLWQAQTPQCFRPHVLDRAHREADRRGLSATDDAALAEALGIPVHVTRASPWNFKITEPEDLKVAAALLRMRQEETG